MAFPEKPYLHGPRRTRREASLLRLLVVLALAALLAAPLVQTAPAPITFRAPVIVNPAEGAGEPGLAIDANDNLYLNVLFAPGDTIYKSVGTGDVWAPLPLSDYAFGGGDSDLAVDEHGNLYLTGQWWLNSYCMSVATSRSGGIGWTIHPLACDMSQGVRSHDRPWIVAFTPDGQTLPHVFLAYHSPCCDGTHIVMRSTDGGVTFQPAAFPTRTGGFPGNLVADRDSDTLYYFYYSWGTGRFAPTVARSTDLGLTWTEHRIADHPGWGTGLHRVTGAVDRAGNLYAVWSENRGSGFDVYMASSTTGGASWSTPVKVNAGAGTHIFPWIVAGAAGKVNVAYYKTPVVGDPNSMPSSPTPEWHVVMSQSLDALAATPTWEHVQVSQQVIHRNSLCTSGVACGTMNSDRSLLDFFEVEIDSRGYANVVWAQTVNRGLVSQRLGLSPVNVFAQQATGPGLV